MKLLLMECAWGGGWLSDLIQLSPAMPDGLASVGAGGARHGAGCGLTFKERTAGGALKVTQSNNGMHPTADTRVVI